MFRLCYTATVPRYYIDRCKGRAQSSYPNRRPEYQAHDGVNFHKQLAYITLLYANQTTGIKIPNIFDPEKQEL